MLVQYLNYELTMEVWQQDWMAKWAVYSPHKIAIKEYETGNTLSYLQLNSLGNRLAFYLTEKLNLVKSDRRQAKHLAPE